ncbi:PilW family protein [Arenicella xantha]|uniref:Pilin/secretion family protein with methylation motif n=1 Tax=Arenicella xantha TaxID=644221 RepID=A0A395JSX3_9GAMM|nr:PilW family protein [Arenicella xantha]RBP52658.1 pilin/secretion family protein with methylation motif [Arenicella xantha]
MSTFKTEAHTVKPFVRANSGFTLVELLVGLFLSLFIGGMALTYMVSSSRTFRIQTGDSISQENARFALEIISQNLRLAGINPSNSFANKLDVVYNGDNCPANESSISNGDSQGCTVDELANNSDRIAVDFIADSSFTGCNFAAVTVPLGIEKRYANVFWTADLDNDGVRSLYCQTYNITDSQIEGPAAPLIDGVDRLQAQYGVDNDQDDVIDRYQSYTNLTPAFSSRVKSIRFALLVGSGVDLDAGANTEDNIERKYQLLDGPEISITDRVKREIYSTTVMLPNGM